VLCELKTEMEWMKNGAPLTCDLKCPYYAFSDITVVTNHNRLDHMTNQSRVDQSQQTGPPDQSEQSRPITTDWTIWPIRAEQALRKEGCERDFGHCEKKGDAAMYTRRKV